jgi:hypothetical protein
LTLCKISKLATPSENGSTNISTGTVYAVNERVGDEAFLLLFRENFSLSSFDKHYPAKMIKSIVCDGGMILNGVFDPTLPDCPSMLCL